MIKCDAIIMGADQAGRLLARHIPGTNMGAAIIERSRFGGTCVRPGCTPTKTLVGGDCAVHLARRSTKFGFTAADIKVDMQRVKSVQGSCRQAIQRQIRAVIEKSGPLPYP